MWKKVLLLLAVVLVREALGNRPHCNGHAKNIVRLANSTKEQIGAFKDDFVYDIFGLEWETASSLLPPGSVDDGCLPPPPPPSGTYEVSNNFAEEVVRMYSLIQGYSTALNHLTLDRILNFSHERTYVGEVQYASNNLDLLLNHLSAGIKCHNRTPDNTETERHLSKIYTDVGSDRNRRDFAILRDTIDALIHCIEVFKSFSAS